MVQFSIIKRSNRDIFICFGDKKRLKQTNRKTKQLIVLKWQEWSLDFRHSLSFIKDYNEQLFRNKILFFYKMENLL